MPPKRAVNFSFVEDAADMMAEVSQPKATQTPQFEMAGVRAESLHIGFIRPNPANPRRIFPYEISMAFHAGELTPQQALDEFIEHVREISYSMGRGFDSIFELLPRSHEDEKEVAYTPEEKTLRDLVVLAVTLRDDNQIYPITVVNISEGAKIQYMIETGERRYWATHILMRHLPGYDGDGKIPCADVTGKYSVYRMAKENTTSSPLNATAMARQIALLLLASHGITPPVYGLTNDFYRQALDFDMRGKQVSAQEILTALGGINRRMFSRYKALLNLCDVAMEMADRHNVEERRLRPLVDLDAEGQIEILQSALTDDWDSRQIEVAATKWRMGERPEKKTLPTKLPAAAASVVKAMLRAEKATAQDIVSGLVENGDDVESIRGRIKKFRRLLDDAERLLSS